MNMHKKWFSFSLYREGLRQLKVITCLFSLIAAAYGILSNVGIWVNNSRYMNPADVAPALRSMPGAQPFVMISFCVLAPILTLYLFRFTNSRRDSDFYHALPESRVCLFLSFYAAILTSIVFYLAVCVLSTGISALLLSHWVKLDWTSVLHYVTSMFAASFYVTAFVSIAMAVTGTFLSNVVVSGLLIFGPRIILTVLVQMVNSALPYVLLDFDNPLLNNQYNIVNGLIFGFLGSNYSYSIVLASPAAFCCTVAMGILLTAIAALLFYRRKSEAAGQSAPNRILGAIYRLSLTYMVSLIPISIIFEYKTGGYRFDRTVIFNLFILYLVVAAVFYLYELLMTKKLKRLWQITPSFLLIPVLNILTLVIMNGCYNSALSFTPASYEITGIRVLVNRSYRSDLGSYYYNYYEKKAEDIPLESEEICSIISGSLQNQTDAFLEDSYWSYISSHPENIDIAVKTRGKTAYRTVHMTTPDMEALADQLSLHPQLEEIFSTLPDLHALSFRMYLDDADIPRNSPLEQDLYEALQSDMEEMGFVRWYSYINRLDDSQGNPVTLAYLTLCVTQNDALLALDVPISAALPHTSSVYLASLPDPQDSLAEFSQALGQYSGGMSGGVNGYLETDCSVYLPDGMQYGLYAYINSFSGEENGVESDGIASYEDLQQVLKDLSACAADEVRDDQILIRIGGNWYIEDEGKGGQYTLDPVWIKLNEMPESIRKWISFQYDPESIDTEIVY